MNILRSVIGCSLVLLLSVGCSERKRTAKSAFEKVQGEVKSGTPKGVLLAMEEGYPVMREFLTIVDSGIVSDDEKSRSTSYVCISALKMTFESGQLAKVVEKDDLDSFRSFDWQNEGEAYRMHTDLKYKQKMVPTVVSFEARNQRR